MRNVVVSGAAIVREETRIILDGVPDQPGISHRVFSALAEKNLVVDMIAQNVGSGGKTAIGFTVLRNDLATALALLEPLAQEMGARVWQPEDVSKVSVVGIGMRTHTGVAERMFAALNAQSIQIKMITTGDIKISALVDKADGIRALRAVHHAFRLHEPRAGSGLPGPGEPSAFRERPAVLPDEPVGTLLADRVQQLASMEDIVVNDVVLSSDEGRITIFDLLDGPGSCSRVFQAVAAGGINVDMIVQNMTSKGRAEMSFSVPPGDLAKALTITQQVVQEMDSTTRVVADADIARLFVFGVGMRTHTGVAHRMFGALADRGINIAMINTSEVCVSVVVERDRGPEALASLKAAFKIG
jgi:aspartate kinase